jgi:hypothetical protein
LDGEFIERKLFSGNGGLAWFFAASGNERALIQQIRVFDENPRSEVLLFDTNFDKQSMLATAPDKLFVPQYADGKFQGYVINAYAPRQVSYADSSTNEIIVGNNIRPEFDIFDNNGKKLRTIKYDGVRREVTKEDRDEYKMQKFGWVLDLKFPDEHPYYDMIVPLTNGRYMVALFSPFFCRLRGIVINESGQSLGRFEYTLGENSGFYAVRGRVFAMMLNKEDDLMLQEILFDTPAQEGSP